MGSLPRREPRLRQSPPCLETASVRKGRRGIVVGDSLLWGTEGSICRPDPTCKEVCCLPGARVRDITRKLPKLVRSTDYFPLLIVQVGSDEIARKSIRTMKRFFRGLGRLVQGAGAQVIFCSIPSGAVRDMERTWKVQVMNNWLRGWCRGRNFGFFDHGAVYLAPGLLSMNGTHLSQRGKRILLQALAGLIKRALI